MGNTQNTNERRILPGDVVQIAADASPFTGLFGTVTAVRSWGAIVSLPRPRDTPVLVRMGLDTIVSIGVAVLMDPEVQTARETLLGTIREADDEALARTLSGHPVVMQLAGMPNGGPTGMDGQYLEEFDFEAFDGTGNVILTTDIRKAKQFMSLADALRYRDTSPACKPLRDDGFPNKPLTATTWAIVPAQSGEKH